jgi:hypothetical protein
LSYLKYAPLASSAVAFISGTTALILNLQIRSTDVAHGMALLESSLELGCGFMLIGWWRLVYPSRVDRFRRRIAIYSNQFAGSFLVMCIFVIVIVLTSSGPPKSLNFTVSLELMILSLFCIANWLFFVGADVRKTGHKK